jgi:hypothetical protein
LVEITMKFEIRNLKLIFATFVLAVNICTAQVVEYPLNSNGTIISYRLQHKDDVRHSTAATDTLSLPFIDDFAQEGIYPSSDLWLDSGAFVNSTFCDNPPTYSVATFDGINKFGNRYTTSSARQYCDTMTSKPIRIAFAQTDTTVWLSFYYQPQGLGIAPGSNDTLILQFKDTANRWSRVWYKNGSNKQPFQRVNIHVTDLKYCYDGFQFRFVNYGWGNANTDHWNVDYIKMNNNRADNDSLSDIGIINAPVSILSEYTSMPWPHYTSSMSLENSVADSARNMGYGPTTTVVDFYTVFDETGNILYRDSINLSSFPGDVTAFTHSLSLDSFPHTSADSAFFLIQDSLDKHGLLVDRNDVAYYNQKFYNYYSYDDGTAELNAGIEGTTPKWAMKFDVKMRDTLRGVQVYFNPLSYDVSSLEIDPTVWTNVSPPSTEQLLYSSSTQHPYNIDSINGFATYLFDVPQIVGPGNIWVGFIQHESIKIGIGVDKNNDSHTKMFYFENGQWFQYSFSSTWMIRPFFGKEVTLIGVDEISSNENFFKVYPVPATDKIHFSFEGNQPSQHKLNYELSDIAGRVAMLGTLSSNELDVSKLNSGIYFVRLSDNRNRSYSNPKKIIVHH